MVVLLMYLDFDVVGTGFVQELYLCRAPRIKGTLPDFREKCRVTRHSRVFRGLTGSQWNPGKWGVIVLTVPMSTVASKAAFSAGGRVVSKKQCNLSLEAIEVVVCLQDWNLADKRLHDHVREAALVTDTENLNLSKHEWIHDNSLSPEDND